MSDLTARLAEALAVCDAATRGEWTHGKNLAEVRDPNDLVVATVAVRGYIDLAEANAEFIAHARTGYPAALRALQAAIGLEPERMNGDRMMGYELEQAEGYNRALRDVRQAIQEVYGDE